MPLYGTLSCITSDLGNNPLPKKGRVSQVEAENLLLASDNKIQEVKCESKIKNWNNFTYNGVI